jgi:hypothetical protein
VSFLSEAQKPKGKWTIGLTGSVEYFIRTIKDVERFNIDTNLFLGMTDTEWLAKREEIDEPYFPGKTAGFLLGYKKSPRIELETGLRFVEGGAKIDMNDVTDFNLIQNVFGIHNTGEVIVNKFRLIELPIIIKHRLGSSNKHDLAGRKKGTPMTNMYRYFFFTYGVGVGFPVNDNLYYNGVEYSGIDGSIGLAGLASVGYHIDTRSPFFINFRAHARATFLSYYEYAPIQSYYHSIGAEVKLGYRFAYKSKQKKSKATDCTSFSDGPNSKSRPKFMFGMRYGANLNSLRGSDASNPAIGLKGLTPARFEDVETSSGETTSNLTPHLGLNLEYSFHPNFSLGVSPIYTQRGFKSKHTYFIDDGRTIKTRQRVYIDYVDVPVRFIYYPTPQYWAHVSATVSFYTSNKLYDYYQVYNGLINFPNENINHRDDSDVSSYYGDNPDKFMLGWEFGAGAHLDNHVAVSAQIAFYQSIFQKGQGSENFWNSSLQVSMYYYFYKQ